MRDIDDALEAGRKRAQRTKRAIETSALNEAEKALASGLLLSYGNALMTWLTWAIQQEASNDADPENIVRTVLSAMRDNYDDPRDLN